MRRRRLIVVDDNPIFVRVLGDALEGRGYVVDRALSYDEAMHSIRRWAPDCAVLDLNLAGRSGLGLIQPLKEVNAECRVIMLTGFASISTAVDAVKLGADQYLAKPIAVADILRALDDDVRVVANGPQSGPLSVGKLEWEHINRVLGENDGNISVTARALGLHRRTLQRKLKRQPPD